MGQITDFAAEVYRRFITDGLPSSGEHEPNKTEIVGLFGTVEAALTSVINGVIAGNAVSYPTLTELQADLVHDAGELGVVYDDGVPANNGIYVKLGASGAGSWDLTELALPASYAVDLASKQPLNTFLTALSGHETYGELLTALGAQPLDADLASIASLAGAADKILVGVGASTWALKDFSAPAQALTAAASYSAMVTLLGAASQADLDALTTDLPGMIETGIADYVDTVPEALAALQELADLLVDVPTATAILTALGNRVRVDTNAQGLDATQKANARTNIGAVSAAEVIAAISHNAVVTALGFRPVPFVATLALAAAMTLQATDEYVFVERYDATSEPSVTGYRKNAAGDPGGALKFQNAATGNWFVVDDDEVDILAAGAPVATVARDATSGELVATGTGTASAALLRVVAMGKTAIVSRPHIFDETNISVAATIKFIPDASIWASHAITPRRGAAFPAAGMAAKNMFKLNAHGIRLQSPRIWAAPCRTITDTSDLSGAIVVERQGTTLPTQNDHWLGAEVSDAFVWGGSNGVNARSAAGFRLLGENRFAWQFDQGVVIAGDVEDQELNFLVEYTGCKSGSGSGGFRVGTDVGSNLRSFKVRGKVKWCGFLTGGGAQSGCDFFVRSGERVDIEVVCENSGDATEIKKEFDSTSSGDYSDFQLKIKSLQNMCEFNNVGFVHLTMREDVNSAPSLSAGDVTENLALAPGSRVVSDPFTQKFTLGVNAISVTAGQRRATITLPSHWGRTGEMIKIFGIAGGIGGVSATEFMREQKIVKVDGNTVTIELAYAATSTAFGGTGADCHCLFKLPQDVTLDFANGSQTVTVNWTGHGFVADQHVDLSGIATTVGVDATLLNRRFVIRAPVTTNSFKIVIPKAANADSAGVAAKARGRRNRGETAVWLVGWRQFVGQAVNVYGTAVALNVEGLTAAGPIDDPTVGPRFLGWVFHNCGQLPRFGDGYVDDMELRNCSGSFYSAGMQPGSDSKAVRRMKTSGNKFTFRAGNGNAFFMSGSGFQDCTTDPTDEIIVDAGYAGYYQATAPTGVNEQTTNCKFEHRAINDNPDKPGTAAGSFECYRIDGGATGLQVCNSPDMRPGGTRPSITRAGVAGIGASGKSSNNRRGTTPNNSATPVSGVGAAVGDYWVAETGAAGYWAQLCTVDGFSGGPPTIVAV